MLHGCINEVITWAAICNRMHMVAFYMQVIID